MAENVDVRESSDLQGMLNQINQTLDQQMDTIRQYMNENKFESGTTLPKSVNGDLLDCSILTQFNEQYDVSKREPQQKISAFQGVIKQLHIAKQKLEELKQNAKQINGTKAFHNSDIKSQMHSMINQIVLNLNKRQINVELKLSKSTEDTQFQHSQRYQNANNSFQNLLKSYLKQDLTFLAQTNNKILPYILKEDLSNQLQSIKNIDSDELGYIFKQIQDIKQAEIEKNRLSCIRSSVMMLAAINAFSFLLLI